jgi:cytochrome P450 family 12
MATNPDKQEKLRAELSTLLPEGSSKITPESLISMPYLRACIKEAARLYPVTPGTMRILTKDIILNGYHIPKGVSVN